jgi:hypothetical protein
LRPGCGRDHDGGVAASFLAGPEMKVEQMIERANAKA